MNTSGQVRYTFRKEERLSSKKYIKELFENGSSFFLFPFKILYLKHQVEDIYPCQVLFTVPTKTFKKATDRNLIKRRIREAYRLNKSKLNIDQEPPKLLIAYIYVGKSIPSFKEVEDKIKQSIRRLSKKIKSKGDHE